MIKPYFLLGVLSIFAVLMLDKFTKTGLVKSKKFWALHCIVILLTTFVDSYSSGRPIVVFNDAAITGIRIFPVPLENYLFGFSLITLNILLFEKYAKKRSEK